MASPVEVIPGWSAINERLDTTLVQLNHLMHYYADVTPEDALQDCDPSKKPCVSEECLDTNMRDILRAAQTRLQQFMETMQRFTGGPSTSAGHPSRQLRESNEKLRECENTIDQVRDNSEPNIKLIRELERTRAELLERTREYEAILSMKERATNELNELKKIRQEEVRGRQHEAGREKMQKQREVRNLKENFQREVLTATQHHLDREMELQKYCQKEKDAHFKSIGDMMDLHKEKIKNLKEEHAAKVEECCQNHASLESEWQDQEFKLQNKISEAVQEKAGVIQQLFDERVKVQNLEDKVAGLESKLSSEKTSKGQVESELKFAKVDICLMNEKLKMGEKTQEQIQFSFTNLQDEMMNLKCKQAIELTKVEERALALQKDLSSLTSTCVYSEHELQSHKIKLERLQNNIEIKQKDLIAASSEMQKLHQEVKFLQSEIKSKNEDIKSIQRNNETQCQQLQTTVFKLKMEEKQKCENMVLKTKEAMETEYQRQAHQNKENVLKLQKQIRMQRDELNKHSSSNYRWGTEGMCRS